MNGSTVNIEEWSPFSGRAMDSAERGLFVLLLCACAVVAGCLNAFSFLVFARNRILYTPNNYLVANLLIADLLYVTSGIFQLLSVINGKWLFSFVLCQMVGFGEQLLSAVAMATVVSIAMHRHISISLPNGNVFGSKKSIALLLGVIWVFALLCCGPVVVGSMTYDFSGTLQTCTLIVTYNQLRHVMYIFFIQYCVPCVAVLGFYSLIYRTILAHDRTIREKRIYSRKIQRKSIKLMVCVTLTFFVTFTPYHLLVLVNSAIEIAIPDAILVVTWILVISNRISNPILYTLFNRLYLKCAVYSLKCRGPLRHKAHSRMFVHRNTQPGFTVPSPYIASSYRRSATDAATTSDLENSIIKRRGMLRNHSTTVQSLLTNVTKITNDCDLESMEYKQESDTNKTPVVKRPTKTARVNFTKTRVSRTTLTVPKVHFNEVVRSSYNNDQPIDGATAKTVSSITVDDGGDITVSQEQNKGTARWATTIKVKQTINHYPPVSSGCKITLPTITITSYDDQIVSSQDDVTERKHREGQSSWDKILRIPQLNPTVRHAVNRFSRGTKSKNSTDTLTPMSCNTKHGLSVPKLDPTRSETNNRLSSTTNRVQDSIVDNSASQQQQKSFAFVKPLDKQRETKSKTESVESQRDKSDRISAVLLGEFDFEADDSDDVFVESSEDQHGSKIPAMTSPNAATTKTSWDSILKRSVLNPSVRKAAGLFTRLRKKNSNAVEPQKTSNGQDQFELPFVKADE